MNWQEYFNNIAHAVALKSKDPSSKVGCVIVDSENRIISQGYNGFVAGCDESKMTWDRPMKYALVIHAELNALIHARRDLKGSKMYVTHGPCENCLKHALQAGIREIYYKDPGIMRDRSTPEQKEAIQRLIQATEAKVVNVDTLKEYTHDLGIVKPTETGELVFDLHVFEIEFGNKLDIEAYKPGDEHTVIARFKVDKSNIGDFADDVDVQEYAIYHLEKMFTNTVKLNTTTFHRF